MKTIKFFIILGMILGAILIFPIIVGAITLNRLNEAKKKEDITGVAICTLIFCSVIAGILMLCMTEDDFAKKNSLTKYEQKLVDSVICAMDEETEDNDVYDDEIVVKLRKLKALFNEGLIDEQEYLERRKRYLDDL